MNRVLFFSYNLITFGDEPRVSNNQRLAVTRTGITTQQAAIVTGSIVNQRRDLDTISAEVEIMIQSVTDVSVFDKVVIYLGTAGTEKVIEFARTVPPEKLVIVTCKCGKKKKIRLFKEMGLKRSQVIPCNCGGQQAMGGLITAFLNTETVSETFFRQFALSAKKRVLPRCGTLTVQFN